MRNLVKVGLPVVGGVLAVASGSALAAIDTASALAAVEDAETAIVAVGGALIGLAAIGLALRWVKGMFF